MAHTFAGVASRSPPSQLLFSLFKLRYVWLVPVLPYLKVHTGIIGRASKEEQRKSPDGTRLRVPVPVPDHLPTGISSSGPANLNPSSAWFGASINRSPPARQKRQARLGFAQKTAVQAFHTPSRPFRYAVVVIGAISLSAAAAAAAAYPRSSRNKYELPPPGVCPFLALSPSHIPLQVRSRAARPRLALEGRVSLDVTCTHAGTPLPKTSQHATDLMLPVCFNFVSSHKVDLVSARRGRRRFISSKVGRDGAACLPSGRTRLSPDPGFISPDRSTSHGALHLDKLTTDR